MGPLLPARGRAGGRGHLLAQTPVTDELTVARERDLAAVRDQALLGAREAMRAYAAAPCHFPERAAIQALEFIGITEDFSEALDFC